MSQSHLGEQLLAYLDGELSLSEARQVEAHVVQCLQCAAELAELRALSQGLGQTLDTVLSPVKLSREADERIRAILRQRLERRERAGWLWRLWGRRMQVAQAALAIMLLVFSFGTYRVLSLPAPVAAQEVLVFGESRLAPGSQGSLRVIVRAVGASGSAPAGSSLASAISPVAGARVIISLLTESGVLAPLYEGETDHLGTVNAAFTVPEVPEGSAELVIEASSEAGEERLEQTVEIARAYKIYVMADKPAYRPGQTLQMRALVLDSTNLRPVSGEALQWRVTEPSGETLCRDAASLSDYGVSTWQCSLPPEADEGIYVLSATLGDTTTERAVRVEDY
ncbi:MAG: MG2 domain-containing protein, partial [Anaerolineae bacterium]|nr:MG2 domain-containing protein [Anaerolineae bacterium]